MMRVLTLAIQDRNYPRYQMVSRFLRGWSDDVVEIDLPLRDRIGRWALFSRAWQLLRAGYSAPGTYDVVVLTEFSSIYAIVSWIISRNRKAVHIVDGFVGLYETEVEDRQRYSSKSGIARVMKWLDRAAVRCADIYLTDTDLRAQSISASQTGSGRVISVPVGCPGWVRAAADRPSLEDSSLRLLYYGHFVPLHGVDVILRAVAAAHARFDIKLTLIGNGETRAAAESLSVSLGLAHYCTYLSSVSPDELMTAIDNHDVVLGIFGDSPKARSVIANKVWEGLAAGKPVVTRTSNALAEIRAFAPSTLIEVNSDLSPEVPLAAALEQLAALKRVGLLPFDPDVRERLDLYVQDRFIELGRALEQELFDRAP